MHRTVTARRQRGEPPHEWLSPTSAARRLRVPVRSILRLINEGELPAYRYADRIIRIRADDLYRLQRKRKEAATLD